MYPLSPLWLVLQGDIIRANFVIAVPDPIDQLHVLVSSIGSERDCFESNLSLQRNAAEHAAEG